MEQLCVVEEFVSINGEGRRAGQLALFIRFAGCNLNCEYCDTKWANEKDVPYVIYSVDALYQRIKEAKVKNVTLTGGEPLLQPDMKQLLKRLRQDPALRIEIETNGSVDIRPFMEKETDDSGRQSADEGGDGGEKRNASHHGQADNVSFTLDYKTAVSGMEDRMCLVNYENVRAQDTVKFVVGNLLDLQRAENIIEQYHLVEKGCGIYLSPCFGKIEPSEMVDFLIEHNMNDVNIQLQLHKFIWDPELRGV